MSSLGQMPRRKRTSGIPYTDHPMVWTIYHCPLCFEQIGAYRAIGAFWGKPALQIAHAPFCPENSINKRKTL